MKRLLTLLIAALVLSNAALAAEAGTAGQGSVPKELPAVYPMEVRETESGAYRRVEKVYLLKTTDDPAVIPTGDFEREGVRFTLLDLLREDQSETETREHVETVTLSSGTSDMAAILEMLDAAMEAETEDGFSGTLTLDPKSITAEAAGYKSTTRTVTATRTYPNLASADVSLVPKTAEENGRTLTLTNVSWQTAAGSNPELPTLFTATATYTGEAASSYATGYHVNASYGGTLTRTTNDTVIYTAVFTGAAELPSAATEEAAPQSPDYHPVLLIALLVLALAGAGWGLFQLIKHFKRRAHT